MKCFPWAISIFYVLQLTVSLHLYLLIHDNLGSPFLCGYSVIGQNGFDLVNFWAFHVYLFLLPVNVTWSQRLRWSLQQASVNLSSKVIKIMRGLSFSPVVHDFGSIGTMTYIRSSSIQCGTVDSSSSFYFSPSFSIVLLTVHLDAKLHSSRHTKNFYLCFSRLFA